MSSIEEKFLQTFGEEPDLIAAAPGRVNLIGEHIDYSDVLYFPLQLMIAQQLLLESVMIQGSELLQHNDATR